MPAITVDKKGFPRIDLGVAVPTKSGNAFHDKFTGKFSFAPPGVIILEGSDLIKNLSTSSRKVLFERAKVGRANQLSARIIEGKLHIVLLNNGKRVDSFALRPTSEKKGEQAKSGQDTSKLGKGVPELSDSERDNILEIARDLNLVGDKLKKRLEKIFEGQLSPGDKEVVKRMIDQQRIDDLVAYLHQNLLKKLKEDKSTSKVKILTPRGYLRKSFANIDEPTMKIILQRLQGKGWSEQELQDNVVKSLPARLKEHLTTNTEKGKPFDQTKQK
jgi:hypothetical protein